MVSNFNKRTLNFYLENTNFVRHEAPIPHNALWMWAGLCMIAMFVFVLIFLLRCWFLQSARVFGLNDEFRVTRSRNAISMYSVDIKALQQNDGFTNLAYIHREAVADMV